MNRKLSHSEALHFIKDYFMGGGEKKIECMKDAKGVCSVNGTGLHPEWCEMTSDRGCIYNNPGPDNIPLQEISNISANFCKSFLDVLYKIFFKATIF